MNPVPNSVVYSSSKAAVDTITRALAVELAPKKIRVNAIAPGATETEGTKTMGLTMEAAKAMGMVMPMGRMGQPDDIARVALFLASDQSSWLTGERISPRRAAIDAGSKLWHARTEANANSRPRDSGSGASVFHELDPGFRTIG